MEHTLRPHIINQTQQNQEMVDDQNELHIYVMYPPYYYALVLTCDWLNECFKKKVLPHFPKITMWKLDMLQREPLHPWLQCLGFDGFPPYFHEFRLTHDAPLPTANHYLRGPYAKMYSWTN